MSKQGNHLDSLSLSLLVDDMLPKKTAEEFHKHIASCPQCEQAYDDLLAMSFAMATMEVVAVPEGFADGIMQNLPPQDEKSSKAEEIIEIKEYHSKQSFWANLDMKQAGLLAACAVLALSFFVAPPESAFQNETANPSSTQSSTTEQDELSVDAITEQAIDVRLNPEEATVANPVPALESEPTAEDMEIISNPSIPQQAVFVDYHLQLSQVQHEDLATLLNAYPTTLFSLVLEHLEEYPSLPLMEQWSITSDAPSLCHTFSTVGQIAELEGDFPEFFATEPETTEVVLLILPLS